MANSKYEYVKEFEVKDFVFQPNIIVARITGRNFKRFSELHEFEKPNDERALKLMNSCAMSLIEEFPDVVLAYGFSDEYSFIFKKDTKFYNRRASKILSVIVSFFTSLYAAKWNYFFPEKKLRSTPSFRSQIICCASMEVLQAYLFWRQDDCHEQNLYNTCLWEQIKHGKDETEALKVLEGTQKQEKNEMLFQLFGINYKNVPAMFRQGSCILNPEVVDTVKENDVGSPSNRLQIIHSKNIVSRSFWKEYSFLHKKLGSLEQDIRKIEQEYKKSFQFENKLMPSTWIVVRIDGRQFHSFSAVHEFEKPNDEQALKLMNSCAVAIVEEFSADIVFAYGVSDEYSFVLKKDSQLHQRHASEIVSAIVSFFSCSYLLKWRDLFPKKDLKSLPSFDGRCVCYPSSKILRDYLTWRQVDCHINNLYNTCFWALVNSGKNKSEAHHELKGKAEEKYKLLSQQFGIDYNSLPMMYRRGTSIYWDEEKTPMKNSMGNMSEAHKKLVVDHCNIIDASFWDDHPSILDEK